MWASMFNCTNPENQPVNPIARELMRFIRAAMSVARSVVDLEIIHATINYLDYLFTSETDDQDDMLEP